MTSLNLPEPLLSLSLGPVDKIKQNDHFAVGGLWSVLTKVKGAVADGRRLENITWRLWYRARSSSKHLSTTLAVPHGVPISREAPMRPPLLSSPSLTSSTSSSEGTNSSSEWDKETAVNDEEDLLAQNTGTAQPTTVVSPPAVKAVLGFARPTAPSGAQPHQQELSIQDAYIRKHPETPLVSSPHHPPQADADAHSGLSQGTSYSGSKYHSRNPYGPSASPHFPLAPLTITTAMVVSPSNTLNHSSLSSKPVPEPIIQSLAYQITASSAELVGKPDLPSVGNLVSFLLSDEVMSSRLAQHVKALKMKQISPPLIVTGNKLDEAMPKIVEPPPTPSPPVQPGSSPSYQVHSAVTSATSTPRQSFPTVVVVNPTPHPTPPTTPSEEQRPPDARSPTLSPSAITPPITQPHKPPSPNWNGAMTINGQLGTPVSVNGNSIGSPSIKTNHRDSPEIRTGYSGPSHGDCSNTTHDASSPPLSSLGVTTNLVLPDKQTQRKVSSHLPTPAAEVSKGLTSNANMAPPVSSPAPIPQPPPSEEKKFFLAAPHSGSGGSGHSTDSPGSTRMDSFSPSRRGGIHRAAIMGSRDVLDRREESKGPAEEDVASSFSAGSPAGRAPSIASSKGGTKFKRAMFTVAGPKAGAAKRKTGKKVTLVHTHKRENSITEEVRAESSSSKGKEKEKEDDTGVMPPPTTPANNLGPRAKSMQHLPLTAQHLRQLPTVPPRRPLSNSRAVSPSRNATNGSTSSQVQATTFHVAAPQRTNTQLPYHPQLPLGHLPTVPPAKRRPIEITESSDYSTTDTDEDESWESESMSGNEGKTGRKAASPEPLKNANAKAGPSLARNGRTRDLNEFARDAALEAQRQREMFQKLPSQSYSNLSQLPRTKSGLSMLFRPDPELFPEGHPYTRTQSHHDILARNWSSPAPPLAMNPLTRRAPAEPVPAQVTVSSVNNSSSNLAAMARQNRRNSSQSQQARNGYRSRIRPPDEGEVETETDDDPDDGIQVSTSVAERRLAALVGARSARQSQPPPQTQSQAPVPAPSANAPSNQSIQRTATLPIIHAYLPEPAPLQTPQTIRKNIISQELDEDLRRNLLWERQNNKDGPRRPPRAPATILPGPWRPLTALRPTSETQEQKPADQDPNRRTFATQRTKSWAGDYHAHGW